MVLDNDTKNVLDHRTAGIHELAARPVYSYFCPLIQ